LDCLRPKCGTGLVIGDRTQFDSPELTSIENTGKNIGIWGDQMEAKEWEATNKVEENPNATIARSDHQRRTQEKIRLRK